MDVTPWGALAPRLYDFMLPFYESGITFSAFTEVVGLISVGRLDVRLALIAALHRSVAPESAEGADEVCHEEFALIWSSLSEIFSTDPDLETAYNEIIAVAVLLATGKEDIPISPAPVFDSPVASPAPANTENLPTSPVDATSDIGASNHIDGAVGETAVGNDIDTDTRGRSHSRGSTNANESSTVLRRRSSTFSETVDAEETDEQKGKNSPLSSRSRSKSDASPERKSTTPVDSSL